MKLPKTLSSALNIRPEEELLTTLLFLHSCLVGLSVTSFFAMANASFVADFGSEMLPHAYIVSAIVGSSLGLVYSKLDKYLSFSNLLIVNLAFLLVSVCFFRIGFWISDSKWLSFAIFVWITPVLSLIYIEFWALAGRLYYPKQAKRLFGLVGSGEVAAGILSYFSISFIVERIGAVNLLLISGVSFAICLLILIIITRKFEGIILETESQQPAAKKKVESKFFDLLQNPYLLTIVIVMVFATFAMFFIDYAFLNQAHARYHNKEELACFFGFLYGTAKFVELIVKSVIYGRVLNRFGIKAGLLMLPVMLGLLALGAAITGTLADMGLVFFWLIILTKFFDRIGRRSVYETSFRILYQPLNPRQRLAFQTKTEGIFEPIVTGLAGGALLLFKLIEGFTLVHFSYILLLLIGGWVFVSLLVSQKYSLALTEAIKTGNLGNDVDISMQDKDVFNVIKQKLNSTNPTEVIYSLNMLEDTDELDFEAILARLIKHDSPQVRQDVLKRIETRKISGMQDVVRQKIDTDDSSLVRAAALRTLCALGEADVIEIVLPYLKSDNRHIKKGAMVGLIRHSGPEGSGMVLGDDGLLNMLPKSSEPDQRAYAADILGEVGMRTFYRPLIPLLQDENFRVRRRSIQAASQIGNPRLVGHIINNLTIPAMRSDAMAALIKIGDKALSPLEKMFNNHETDNALRSRIVRIYGRIGGKQATELLLNKMDYAFEEVRYHILVALNLCGYSAKSSQKAAIQQKIEAEVMDAVWTSAVTEDLGLKETSFLRTALDNEIQQNRKRIFLLLSFLYPARSKAILQANDILLYSKSDERAKRDYAMEIIDETVSKKERAFLVPLIEKLSPQERLLRLEYRFPHDTASSVQRLTEIIQRAEGTITPLTKVYILYLVGEMSYTLNLVGKISLDKLIRYIIPNLQADHPVIRETALSTLAKLDSGVFDKYAPKLRNDINPDVKKIANQNEIKGNVTMLLTIEKVIILKDVEIFAQIPEDVLIDLASIMEEEHISKGDQFITQGDMGTHMYLIADGKVDVHIGKKHLIYLGEKQLVGEMALLDSEKRAASVTAAEDSLLLRLDQDTFYELMTDRVEVARGIIKVLNRRVRDLNNQLRDLNEQLETTTTP
jgi:HEAT repeat protein